MKSVIAILALVSVLVPASVVSATSMSVATLNGDSLQSACHLGMYYRGPASEEFGSTYVLVCSVLAPQDDSATAMPAADMVCRMSPKFAVQEMAQAIATTCTLLEPQNDAAMPVLPLAPVPAPCPAGLKYVGPAASTFAGVACLEVDPASVSTYTITKEIPIYTCSALECTPQGRVYLVLRDLGLQE